MSSKTLYPPIVDSYMPAFAVTNIGCDIYFSFSKFNSNLDINNTFVHATVVKQDTNVNVVNLEDEYPQEGDPRFRATGIILNLVPQPTGIDNLYYIRIQNSDLRTRAEGRIGWIPDWVYKIQIRLSGEKYSADSAVGQAEWLKNYAWAFSEWSTVCTVKAINKIQFTLNALDIDTSDPKYTPETVHTYSESTLIATGNFLNCGTEDIYKYNFTLYDDTDHIIEKSGDIYANQFQDNKSYNYLFKTELTNQKEYKLEFKFETINHYEGGAYQNNEEDRDTRIKFIVSYAYLDGIKCDILTAESAIPEGFDLIKHSNFHTHDNKVDPNIDIVAPASSPSYIKETIEQTNNQPNVSSDLLEESKLSTVYEDEEEGRIGLKIYNKDNPLFSGNLCIRRSDSKDNFKTWTDIKIIVVKMQYINDLPVIYDYTIESGVIYKYGVQEIKKDGLRTTLEVGDPVMRNFNYSYLLGKNNKQLKLKFNNDMGSFKIQLQESKIDPIGSAYPIVTRNAATYYKTFPVNGLISFLMDDQTTFCKKADLYTAEEIRDFYESYNSKNNITQYDFIYEKDFRQAVLDFLHDGEIKLFKSPTEGNVIVRLTDINCTPNQTIDRMIYSFTSTAQEMADNTLENYLRYGFYNPGNYETDLSILETKIGQLYMTFTANVDNIFGEIAKKYNSGTNNIGGLKLTVKNIRNLKITFEDKPLRVRNNANELVVGNNFQLGTNIITVYGNNGRMYEFDERQVFPIDTVLKFLNSAETTDKQSQPNNKQKNDTITATIDFLYDVAEEIYQGKEIQKRIISTGIGQLFHECKPGARLFNEIYNKYHIENDFTFRELQSLSSVEIEANPGTVFEIRDLADTSSETGDRYIMNYTGQLRLENLSNIDLINYVGVVNSNGEVDPIPADVLINYQYIVTEGTYKQ